MTGNSEEDVEGNADDIWPVFPRFRDIPATFHSLEAEGPFERCTGCGRSLQDPDCRYAIERIFRGTEPIVEYAMCMECQDGICEELSAESLQRVRAFFQGIDHSSRLARLQRHSGDDDIEPWIGECIVTGKRRSECSAYQVVAVCRGMFIEVSAAPLMISDEGIEQVMELMSKKTRDRMEEFLGDTFGMPPEFCENPDFFPVLL